MATHYIKINKTITPKLLQRKFNAFVELYGESKAVLEGDFTELTPQGNLLPLFGINAEITKIGNKYIDVTMCGANAKIVLPHYDPTFKDFGQPLPKVMFITNH